MAQKGAAGAGAHEWERSWGAPAQGTRLQRGRCRSMEDDAPVIYGLEFQVGPGTAPRRPVPPRSLRRGLGGPKAAVIQERPRARDPRPWEPPPPACRPRRSLWPDSHGSLCCTCLCTIPRALLFLEAGALSVLLLLF